MIKSRKISTIKAAAATVAVLLFAVLFAAFSGLYEARAEETETPPVQSGDLIGPGGDTKYFYLDAPNGICADDDNFYVSLFGGGTEKFTLDGNREPISESEVEGKNLIVKGKLFTLGDSILYDEAGNEIATDVTDAAYAADMLYVLTSGGMIPYPVNEAGEVGTAGETVTLPSGSNAELVATNEKQVFLICEASGAPFKSDIYIYDVESGNVSDKPAYSRAAEITAAVSPAADILFVSQPSHIAKYELKYSLLKETEKIAESDVRALAANSTAVYALTGDGAVVSHAYDLSERKEIIASASSLDGFYRDPTGLFTRRGALLVTDTGNNRVTRIADGGITQLEYGFRQPTAAVSDFLGNCYVAHDTNKIEAFDGEFKHLRTMETDGAITDMKFDSMSNLYILTADGSVYFKAERDEGAKKIEGVANVTAVSVSYTDSEGIYALDSGKTLRKIVRGEDGESGIRFKNERVFAYTDDAISFTADINGDFYFLTANGDIIKYRDLKNDSAEVVKRADAIAGAGANRIILSTVETGAISYGDIIISNGMRHCVQRISGDEFETDVLGDDENTVPDGEPQEQSGSIVYRAERDTEVYPLARDMNADFVIKAGRKFIVVNDGLKARGYVQVLVDDVDGGKGGKGVYGYVHRAQLPAAMKYTERPAKTVTAYSNTSVYKYPSRNAPKLNGYENVEMFSKSFEMLQFVEGFTDDYSRPFRWYRVAVDGGEGYVVSTHFMIGQFRPVGGRYPDENATVLDPGALAYLCGEDGNIARDKDGNPIPISADEQPDIAGGKRVEVIGTFDETQEFTKIYYYDGGIFGDHFLECYVRTEYLKYDGVGRMYFIAILLAILTASGIIVIIVWQAVAKRRKITKA